MFELLHELLSWVLPIGLVCSAAYYCFASAHHEHSSASATPTAPAIGKRPCFGEMQPPARWRIGWPASRGARNHLMMMRRIVTLHSSAV